MKQVKRPYYNEKTDRWVVEAWIADGPFSGQNKFNNETEDAAMRKFNSLLEIGYEIVEEVSNTLVIENKPEAQAPVVITEYVAPAPEYPDNVNAVMDAQSVRKSRFWVNVLECGVYRSFEWSASGVRGQDNYFNPTDVASEMRSIGLLDASNEVTAKGRWWLNQL